MNTSQGFIRFLEMGLINLLFMTFLLLNTHLIALPPAEVYWERVASGLEWHKTENYCPYLTEEKLSQIEPIIKAIHTKEHELHRDYYQVVTSLDSRFLAYQIILKEFYKLQYQLSFDDYEFLRPYKDPEIIKDLPTFFAKYPDLLEGRRLQRKAERLKKKQQEAFWAGVKNDTHPEIMKQLISASLTLETMTSLDSALHVFAQGAGITQKADVHALSRFILDAFSLEGLNSDGVVSCIHELLTNAPSSNEGIILQIFIPKNYMTEIAYVSFGGGFVKRKKTKNLQKYFFRHEQKRDAKDFDTEKNDQVRILAGGLDPEKVKIFRYSTIDEAAIQAYQELVRSKLTSLIRNGKMPLLCSDGILPSQASRNATESGLPVF